MSAAMIAAALGDPRREGRAWRCRCPLHGGHSLVLRDAAGIIFPVMILPVSAIWDMMIEATAGIE